MAIFGSEKLEIAILLGKKIIDKESFLANIIEINKESI